MRLTALGLLRAGYLVVAALATTSLLPRLGVPGDWLPDLVLIGIAATAVVRGPVHGALVGLAAGWLVELIPPVGRPLGMVALTLMVAGATAGAFRRSSSQSVTRPLVALVAAAVVVVAGHAASAVVAEGSFDPTAAGSVLLATLVVGLFLIPAMVAVDRALVRRRLG